MKLLLVSLLLPCLASCSMVRNLGLAGMGAYAGSELDEGGAGGAMLGAAAGVATGALLDHWEDKQTRTAYVDGYQQGRSDEVKRLYWAQQSLHQQQEAQPALKRSYYEIPVPAHIKDGVKIEAHTVVTDIIE
mgnify:CR=1 FL=1